MVDGFTPTCLEKAIALYSIAIEQLVPVSSCRVAEAAKLLENIFRSVNIALVNELKVVYGAMGIDVWEVINAARTKPFGFMAFYPGRVWEGIVSRLIHFTSPGKHANTATTRASSSSQVKSPPRCLNL